MQRSCEFHTYSYPRVFTHVRMFRQEETLLQLKVINEIHNTKQKQTRQFGFEGTYCQERKHFPVYKRSKVFIWCVVRFARYGPIEISHLPKALSAERVIQG